MSQSPLEANEEEAAYFGGWSAVAGLIRGGRSWSGGESNRAFLNIGDGHFADVSAPMGLDLVHDGRSIARVDWDQDGDLDLFVTGRDARRFRYLRNDTFVPGRDQGSAAPTISVRLLGAAPGTNAIGARVEWTPIAADGPPRQSVQRAGEGFLSQSGSWHVLGCGDAPGAAVSVRWSGGELEEFGELEVGSRAILVQGSGRARRAFAPSREAEAQESGASGAEDSPPVVAGDSAVGSAMPLAVHVPLPSMVMETADGKVAELFGLGPNGSRGTGRPLIVHLWASWCAPCIQELGELGSIAEELRSSGVDSLALSLDEESQRSAALRTLQAIDWAGSRGFAAGATAEVLDAIVATVRDSTERLPLPTTLLVSPAGRLAAVYTGPVSGDRLLQDLELLGLTPRERRRRALPFDGVELDPPLEVSLKLFEGKLRRRGLDEAAAEYAIAQVEVQSVDEAQAAYEFGVARARQGRHAEALALFRKSVEADGTVAAAWGALGWAAEVAGESAEALAAYRRAVELEPSDATTRFNLGRLLLSQGELERARAQVTALRAWNAELAERLAREIERR